MNLKNIMLCEKSQMQMTIYDMITYMEFIVIGWDWESGLTTNLLKRISEVMK
jgi:hypothetical protein